MTTALEYLHRIEREQLERQIKRANSLKWALKWAFILGGIGIAALFIIYAIT